MEKIKILFLSANPRDTQFLQLTEEYDNIESYIFKSPRQNLLERILEKEVRATELIGLLQKHKPHIVHFCGHGDENGIFLLDNKGNSKLVNKDDLTQLFNLLKENIRLVVLNACATDSQAKAIADIVGCSIGMNKAVNDPDAILFAASLYKNIAFECPIGKAFELSELQMKFAGCLEAATIPVLYARNDIDPNNINLIKQLYKGSSLLMYPDLWNSFVNILYYAKQIHHIFQTLYIENLNQLVSELDEIVNRINRGIGVAQIHNFIGNWHAYLHNYNNLKNDLGQNFPQQTVVLDTSFKALANTVTNETVLNNLKKANEYYSAIKEKLPSYETAHQGVHTYINNIIVNPADLFNLNVWQKISGNILGFSNSAKGLIVDADNLIKTSIEMLLSA